MAWLKGCMFLVSLVIADVYGYNTSLGIQQDPQICNDLSAVRNGSFYHGPPESTNPGYFVKFDIKEDNENRRWQIKMQMEDGVDNSFVGWAIQVREFGKRDVGLNTSFPVGTVLEYDGISSGWNCPDATGDISIRNGVVHENGPLNSIADIREVAFDWTYISENNADPPRCAKVVGSVMARDNLWYWAEESVCFLTVNGDGEPDKNCPPECDEYNKVLIGAF